MTAPSVGFKLPPVTHNSDGSPKRVGFELEFSGVTLEQTAKTLKDSLGGELKQKTSVEWTLHNEILGDFNIELDWEYLKLEARQNRRLDRDETLVEVLAEMASLLVPIEVACPPIAVADLDALSPMVVALRKAGAVGTDESLLAAYGLHINTDIQRPDAETLHAYLKAFGLLQWWLVDAHRVDITRKMSPYIDLYSDAYLNVLFSGTMPSMERVVADYLYYNPSRNRALDMLPLLSHIDLNAVRRMVDDPKIKVRPAFHYRLPNCNIDRLDWSLSQSWNIWWCVEQLANRPRDLECLGRAFLLAARPILGVSRDAWVEFIGRWLKENGLA